MNDPAWVGVPKTVAVRSFDESLRPGGSAPDEMLHEAPGLPLPGDRENVKL